MNPSAELAQEGLSIAQTAVGTSAPALDVSLWGLVAHADAVVQVVMALLLIASIISWKIIIQKYSYMRRLKHTGQEFERVFWDGASLEGLYDRISRHPSDPFEEVFCAGMREWRESSTTVKTSLKDAKVSMQDRIERAMGLSMDRELTTVRQGLTFLATLASSGPFIGLFGTVWGIMASFQAIAVHQNTNLAVVSRGIAEALFTTALGLLAAIPAAIFYNKLSQDVKKYSANLEAFGDEFLNIVSRQLDQLARTATA